MATQSLDAPFELELLGGWLEQQYRADRPDLEALPWGTLDMSAFSAEQLQSAVTGWTDFVLVERLAAAGAAWVAWLVHRCEAPLDVAVVVGNVARDECVHAELCARVINELGGSVAMQYDRSKTFGAPRAMSSDRVRDAAIAAAVELCAGETLNLRTLALRRATVTAPLLKQVWTIIGREEAQHSAVGFAFVAWAMPMLSQTDIDDMCAASTRVVEVSRRRDQDIIALPDSWFTQLGVFATDDRAAYLQASAAARAETTARIAAWRT